MDGETPLSCGCSSLNLFDDSERHQSEVINTLRLPLIVMVVLFHLYPPEETISSPYVSYNLISTFFSAHGIARLAVPAFFLISGYFFFFHLNEWKKTVYVSKLRKRIKTLLLPYLLWNCIPIFGIVTVRLLMGMKSGTSLSSVKEFGDSIGWLRAFWDCGSANGHPFDVPLWYVRDLMVCSICSPIFYYLTRKLGLVYILLIGCFFLTNIWIDIAGFDLRAWFFFSLGSYLSINNVNMVCLFRKYVTIISPLAIMLLLMTTYFSSFLGGTKPVFNNLFLFFGISALIGCFSYMVSNGIIRNFPYLTKSVFFIYAFHLFPLPKIISITTFFKYLTEKIIVVETQVFTYYVHLAICPITVLIFCIATYSLMHRFTPRFLSVLTGQR